jgi:hypothetical protein
MVKSMSETTKYLFAVILDLKRLEAIKGTQLESKITSMFGGAIKALILDVPIEQGKKILAEFSSARVDARGFLEEVPVTFKRALFDEIVKAKSIEPNVTENVLNRISEIKVAAAKEQENLPPPEI